MNLDTKISALYGIGPKTEKIFNKNNLFTVKDLLYYFPRGYQNRGDTHLLYDTPLDNNAHSFVLTVASEPKSARIKRGFSILKFKAFDDSGSVWITYFNQDYLKDVFNVGATFRFYGKMTIEKNKISLSSPNYEPYAENVSLPDFIPVYPLFYGVSQKQLTKIQRSVCQESDTFLVDYLPESIRLSNNLCTLSFALFNIHFPKDGDSLNAAIKRLTFDELFIFALSLKKMKQAVKTSSSPRLKDCDITPFLSELPFSLTSAQVKAINDIKSDLSGEKSATHNSGDCIFPMNRILVGDVGCGKTVCAASAAYIACKNGYQCALMVPTEILAFQHYEDLSPLFSKLGIECRLLTGSTPLKEKNAILSRLKEKNNIFVIGTHSLIQSSVVFSNLALVITDEQHRFGVNQRSALAEKSKSSHILVMSATPIPRTLSLMIYGDLDISLIDTMPPGRKKVSTYVVDESYRDRLNGFIKKTVDSHHQVYIVCPSVENKKEDADNYEDYNPFDALFGMNLPPLKSAVDYAQNLKENVFPSYRTEFIHGKLKSKDKDRIMMEFSEGRIDILVSTTVIEVGVNVPNATLMIIENAERFGLSQLHQLRGRVGRGDAQSYCVLVSDAQSGKSKERLEIMHTLYDGYSIAERDLKMRGPGEFFSDNTSIRQSGDVDFNIAKSCKDSALVHSAFESARRLIDADPDFKSEENIELSKHIEKEWSNKYSIIN